ncbi:GspE/PulE family protein [Schlesneria paludicola]|uniref:GspE/PulE family protein n=1 Tax=Schlesneria paludicola TaxID=360056 RepID=UPI000299D46E|nr:ATPase, T2SS/T4P/T4SS family [Schlesneria paludicola]
MMEIQTEETVGTPQMVSSEWFRLIAEEGSKLGGAVPLVDRTKDESPAAHTRRAALPEQLVLRATARVLNLPVWETLTGFRPAVTFIREFPIGFARQHLVLAGLNDADQLYLVMPGIEGWPHLDTVRRVLQKTILPAFAPRAEILKAINAGYEQQSTEPDAVLDTMLDGDAATKLQAFQQREDLLVTNGQAPVVELVNLILLDAVKAGASDVHFQPYREKLVIRFRIDGILFDAHSLPKGIQEEALSRVKVMGKMNIAEKRLPQDGRATVTVGDRLIDLRIASLPGSYGERVVLRLLDKSARTYDLTAVGLGDENCRRFRELINLEHGLILLTGPTGSGKTTTLYSALSEINSRDRNVVTLEDPIEYEIDGISQTQINVKKGMTFASGLKNVLRQDPDIIMVGEVRDHETAVMAIQSALTGHLVFSTLHTNDAASAVTRLLDLGIEPYLVSSSLLAVLAQRLVRKVCVECSHDDTMTQEQLEQLGIARNSLKTINYQRGKSCPACRQTGYRGRLAICELLVVQDSIRKKIQERGSASEIRDAAMQGGMQLLLQDGLEKIMSGVTTPEEVARVTVRADL